MTELHPNNFRLRDGKAIFIENKDVKRIKILNNVVWEKPKAPDLVVEKGITNIYRNSNGDLIVNSIKNTTITNVTELVTDISFTNDNDKNIEVETKTITKDGSLNGIMTDIEVIKEGEEKGTIKYEKYETQGGQNGG